MTTHMISTDLIKALIGTGMRVIDDSNIRATFESLDQEAVSHAILTLLRQGYRFADSTMNGRVGCYELTFNAPAGTYPNPVVLRYIHSGYSHIFLALCYLEGDWLEQFTLRYRWSAMGVESPGASELLDAFKDRFGDRQFFWVPVLRYSPIVKH